MAQDWPPGWPPGCLGLPPAPSSPLLAVVIRPGLSVSHVGERCQASQGTSRAWRCFCPGTEHREPPSQAPRWPFWASLLLPISSALQLTSLSTRGHLHEQSICSECLTPTCSRGSLPTRSHKYICKGQYINLCLSTELGTQPREGIRQWPWVAGNRWLDCFYLLLIH